MKDIFASAMVFVFIVGLIFIAETNCSVAETKWSVQGSNAYVWAKNKKMNESIKSIEWNKSDWVKEHAFYSNAASAGVKLWQDSQGGKIHFTGKAPSGTLDEIRFKAITDKGNFNAATVCFDSIANKEDPAVDADKKNWDCSRIYFNTNAMSGKSAAKVGIIAGHEIGHALGLAENNHIVNYITCQEKYGRKATKPHDHETAVVVAKYK